MADDWKPGDLALCVRANWETYACFGGTICPTEPVPGGIYTVIEVAPCPLEGATLTFEGYEASEYVAYAFRKIHPLSIEERNAEIRLLTGKPVKEPAA